MNDSSNYKNRREQLGFCYQKLFILPVKQFTNLKVDLD